VSLILICYGELDEKSESLVHTCYGDPGIESAFLILTSYGELGERSVSWILNCYGEPGEKSAPLILTCYTVAKAKQFSKYGWKWHATKCSFCGCRVIFPYIHEINTK
jgi:hypothetical protein